MTLTSTTTKIQYNGDGSTVSFPITFIYWLNADIKVIHKDAAGTETTWVLGTQYTLTGGEGSTGTLTVEVAPTDYTPASGETLTIKSIVPSTQTTTLPLGGALPSSSIEERLDKNVRLVQQQEEEIDRSIKLSETSTASEVILTDPVTGEFLRWKSDGSLESATITGTGVASSVDETDTDTTKDKLTSNALAKRAEDTAQAVNGVQVASAVNQLQVTNSIATNPVLVEATGDDTNIDVQIDGKGSGTVNIDKLSSSATDVDMSIAPKGSGTVNIDKLSSSATDVDMSIAPKGAGDVILGPQVDIPFIGGNVLAQHKGLVIIRPTVATVDIDADDVILEDTDGRFYRASSVNLTATITTSGANGLDTGAEAGSTWYHLWVIYNGTTVASLMSLSATAPTMPSGYTFKGYVGAVYNNSSSDLVAISQRGNLVATNGFDNILNGGSATSATSIDASVAVPTTAKIINLQLRVDHPTPDTSSTLHVYSDSGLLFKFAELKNPGTLIVNGKSGGVGRGPLLTAQTIYYHVDTASEDGFIWVYGWEY